MKCVVAVLCCDVVGKEFVPCRSAVKHAMHPTETRLKEQVRIGPDKLMVKLLKPMDGDYDLIFSDQNFNMTAEAIKLEIEKRMKML